MTVTVCRGCGRRDGIHEADCRAVRRAELERLQATCDHRGCGATQTTGDPLGPPRCARCGLALPAGFSDLLDQAELWDNVDPLGESRSFDIDLSTKPREEEP